MRREWVIANQSAPRGRKFYTGDHLGSDLSKAWHANLDKAVGYSSERAATTICGFLLKTAPGSIIVPVDVEPGTHKKTLA